MTLLVEVLTWVLLVVGSAFCLVGGVGLLRMPGFYSRVHASGIIDTMGAGFVLAGLALHAGLTPVTIKIVIIFYVLLLTSPTAAHALVNGAYTRGLRPRTQDQGGES